MILAIDSDRALASRAACERRSTNVPGAKHRPRQSRLSLVGWARACQKSAKTLRRRGNIRRNQPRDVTEFKACDQQANSQEKSLTMYARQPLALTRSKATARAPAGIRTKTLKNRPRTAPKKAPPMIRIAISMRPICPMLAYFSYVALMFCLALMFFFGRLCGVHHNICLKARSRKVLFWPHSALARARLAPRNRIPAPVSPWSRRLMCRRRGGKGSRRRQLRCRLCSRNEPRQTRSDRSSLRPPPVSAALQLPPGESNACQGPPGSRTEMLHRRSVCSIGLDDVGIIIVR